MKRRKPLAPWLPGRYGRMTRAELDAESDQYDVEFSAVRAKRASNAKPHPRRRGRPAKRPNEKASRVLITIPPELLSAADAAAKKRGLTRAGLVRQAVVDWLSRRARPRKSA